MERNLTNINRKYKWNIKYKVLQNYKRTPRKNMDKNVDSGF